ncbi:hypothetical protein DKX38_019108 [Salix brachista]|uniref:Uncharacterized protein n=1 Tax=Salix brachista TaxID=2182728 RepID=A0A5N5KQG0_9ROSI|nr:hypothetical protein DKX38_019108 [Salix brachista]
MDVGQAYYNSNNKGDLPSSKVELYVIGIIRHQIFFKPRPKALISTALVITFSQPSDSVMFITVKFVAIEAQIALIRGEFVCDSKGKGRYWYLLVTVHHGGSYYLNILFLLSVHACEFYWVCLRNHSESSWEISSSSYRPRQSWYKTPFWFNSVMSSREKNAALNAGLYPLQDENQNV